MIYPSKIFRIKKEREFIFLEWLNEIAERSNEALATLREEVVSRETYMTFKGNDDFTYLIITNEADQEPKAGNKMNPINQKHQEMKKECLDAITQLGEVALDLKV